MTRAVCRLALTWGVLVLMVLSGCTSGADGNDGRIPDRHPAPAPDPSAYDKAKNQPGAALLQASWSGDRPVDVAWRVGRAPRQSVRQQPFRNESGNWHGLLPIPVTVERGDLVSLSATPAYGQGLTIVAIYYLGVDLCDSLPGSNSVKGLATCNVTIP